MPTAVLIEDDPAIESLLASVLGSEGFEVHSAKSAEDGIDLVKITEADFVILDLELPNIHGHEACRRIREFSDAYIVILTARLDEVDKIVSFNVGADDYVTKPFSTRELVTRLQAMARRPRKLSDNETRSEVIDLNAITRSITDGNREVILTPTEFAIVSALFEKSPKTVTRRELVNQLWSGTSSAHALDVHISNIRKKIKDAGLESAATIQADREGTLRMHISQ